jgi:5-methyltetrahydrofolate--homocysteine methyltransferase
MQAGLKILKPSLAKVDVRAVGKVAIGTIKDNLHNIGKSLVSIILESSRLEIMDLDVDVAPKTFINAVNGSTRIIGVFALFTTAMPSLAGTIWALKTTGLHGKVKIIIGGAPVTQDLANKIGADGFMPDVSSATRVTREIMIP